MLQLIRLADDVPQDDDVIAGVWGAVMIVLLILAVVLLLLSFVKQIRKVQANRDAGVFGDQTDGPDPTTPPEAPRP